MNRSLFFLLLFLSSVAATLATANVVPVVQTQIANQTIYAGAILKVDLSNAFNDPDMKTVRFSTVLGKFDVQLFSGQKHTTVTNFLQYVDQGRYFKTDPTTHHRASNFIHRSVSNFVIQGGGWIGTVNPDDPAHILPTEVAPFPEIPDEIGISNRRGTIAMAKGGPNTATSEWFINLADNGGPPHNLDSPSNSGGYTVFGQVIRNGMAIVDSIAALPIFDFGMPFDTLPLRNYSSTQDLALSNLVSVPDIIEIPPFNFSATTSSSTVATVAIDPDQRRLVITAKQAGTAIITVKATDFDGAFVTQQFNVNVVASPGRLANISTRMQVQSDPNELIAGFIIAGNTSKHVLIRGIGPSLAQSHIANPLANPTLELHAGSTILARNDDWGDSSSRQLIEDTDAAPTSPSEATIVAALPAPPMGHASYTAIMRGIGGTGVGLVEIYDLDRGPSSRLANISSRGIVQTGEDVMIGGLIIAGQNSAQVAVRAIGPSLSSPDITNPLRDPFLELRDAQGVKIAENDNWQTAPNAADIQAAGVAPTNPLESAILRTQAPGRYTAVVSGRGSTPTGVAVVEVYHLQ